MQISIFVDAIMQNIRSKDSTGAFNISTNSFFHQFKELFGQGIKVDGIARQLHGDVEARLAASTGNPLIVSAFVVKFMDKIVAEHLRNED